MPTQVACPQCKSPLRIPDEKLGQLLRCPKCSQTFKAPAPAGGAGPAPPPRPPQAAAPPPRSAPAARPAGPPPPPPPPRRPAPPPPEEAFQDLEEIPPPPPRGAPAARRPRGGEDYDEAPAPRGRPRRGRSDEAPAELAALSASKAGLPGGAILGIVLGGVVAVGLLVTFGTFGVYWVSGAHYQPKKVTIDDDTGPAQWKDYTSDTGKFSVRFPGTPDPEKSLPSDVTMVGVVKPTGVGEYTVRYRDYPPEFIRQGPDAVLDLGRDVLAEGGNVKDEKKTKLTGTNYPGREFTVDAFGGKANCREYLVNNRLYLLKADGKADAKTFLDSFKVTK